MKEALSRVKSAVLSASEGLFEASAGGGVLLMGNRVAHPISQVWFSRSFVRPTFRSCHQVDMLLCGSVFAFSCRSRHVLIVAAVSSVFVCNALLESGRTVRIRM